MASASATIATSSGAEEIDGGPWNDRLGMVKHDGAAKEFSYYSYNAHTDVGLITKEDGRSRATYGYTAYGKDDIQVYTGVDKPDPANPDKKPYNTYRFNAKRLGPATGDYDMGARDYSPERNRFLTRDMYNGALSDLSLGTDPFTMNRYAFAGGNPISGIEVDGHLFGIDIDLPDIDLPDIDWSEVGHVALDVVGMVPVIGEAADLANAAWYAAEGDWTNAALSAAGAIPFAGWAATGTKLAVKGADAVRGATRFADEAAAGATRYADEAAAAGGRSADDVAGTAGRGAGDAGGTAGRGADNAAPGQTTTQTGPPRNSAPPRRPAPAPTKVSPSKADPSAAQAGRACNCLTAGTDVATAEGDKDIEDVRVGDRVWARDMTTGESHLRTVVGLFSKSAERLLTISAGNVRIEVTPEHPFWVVGRGWVDAGALEVGDPLLIMDGHRLPIHGIVARVERVTVYNFEVEGDHNYYITDAQLLVHNCPTGASNNPQRFTDNRRQSRKYGTGVKDIQAKADRYAQSMESRGFEVNVGRLRVGRYGAGRGDITVAVYKKGSTVPVHIRHYITKDKIRP